MEPSVLALAPGLALYACSTLAGAHSKLTWESPARKLLHLFSPFTAYDPSLGVARLLAVIAAAAFFRRRAAIDAGTAIALAGHDGGRCFSPIRRSSRWWCGHSMTGWRLAAPLGQPPDYRLIADETFSPPAPERRPAYLDRWTEFDYVLLLDAGAIDAATFRPDRLELLNSSDMAALYRVKRP